MHCVDLGNSFPTSIYLQKLVSIPPRTRLVKFAGSPRTDLPGGAYGHVASFKSLHDCAVAVKKVATSMRHRTAGLQIRALKF